MSDGTVNGAILPDFAPHQKEALAKMKDGCILWGGVGSGKSRVALGFYVTTEQHEDIYVITTAKKRDTLDWQGEAAKFGIGKAKDSTMAGVLTVDSWNNISKYVDVKDAFFIFDEQRLVGSGLWVKSFLKIAKANRWIMLTATPGDTWMDYIPVFIANGFYKNRTQFKHEHVVLKPFTKFPQVDHYLGIQKLTKHRSDIVVHMKYAREAVRRPQVIWCEHNAELLKRVTRDRWHIYEERPLTGMAELFHVMRQVVNSDPSRMENLLKLLEKHKRMVVWYTFDYELEILRTLKNHYAFTEWNGHRHQEISDTESWVYAVQYTAGAEGWNCTSTNSMTFWSLTYSYKTWEQAHGRTDRMNTPFSELLYFNFRSRSPIDRAIWSALSSKKNFNELIYYQDKSAFSE